MKKTLLYFVIIFFLFSKTYANIYGDLKSELSQLNYSNILSFIKKITLSFELENSFVSSCRSEIKIFKEWGNECKKLLKRIEGIEYLNGIVTDDKFKLFLNDVAIRLDNNESIGIDKIKFSSELKRTTKEMEKMSEYMSEINFLKNKL